MTAWGTPTWMRQSREPSTTGLEVFDNLGTAVTVSAEPTVGRVLRELTAVLDRMAATVKTSTRQKFSGSSLAKSETSRGQKTANPARKANPVSPVHLAQGASAARLVHRDRQGKMVEMAKTAHQPSQRAIRSK